MFISDHVLYLSSCGSKDVITFDFTVVILFLSKWRLRQIRYPEENIVIFDIEHVRSFGLFLYFIGQCMCLVNSASLCSHYGLIIYFLFYLQFCIPCEQRMIVYC